MLFFLGVMPWATAQKVPKEKDNKKANKVYANLGYAEYIKLQGNKDIAKYDTETLLKLGTSYRKTGDFKNTERVYKYLAEHNTEEASYNLYYAQALQSNGQYALAKKYYKIAQEKAGGDEKIASIAAQGAKACSQINAFQARGKVIVKNEKELNSPYLDFSPTFYNDGLVFVSSRTGASSEKIDYWLNENCMDLYQSNPENGIFKTPVAFSDALNSKFHEGPLAFADGGQKVFFTRNNFNNGKRGNSDDKITKLKIYSANNVKGIWQDVEELTFNNKNIDVCHPTLSADEKVMVFASSQGENSQGGMDLYVSYLDGNVWSAPVNLGAEINTAGNEVFPYIHSDGSLYFASNGKGGLGGLDIYMAHLIPNQTDAKWEIPFNLGTPFNSSKDDFGLIMTADKKTGYFTSNRPGGKGQDDIYSFWLEQPIELVQPVPTYPMNICVFDKANNKRIEGATITMNPISTIPSVTTRAIVFTPIEEGSNAYKLLLNEDQTNQQPQFYTNKEGVAAVSMGAGLSYQVEAIKNGFSLGKEIFTMPLTGDTKDTEYCIGLDQSNPIVANSLVNPPAASANPYASSQGVKQGDNIPYYDPNTIFEEGKPYVRGTIMHDEYGRPVANSDITLLNRCTGEEEIVKVDKTGQFGFALECGCEYVVKAHKNNFIGENQIISLLDEKDCAKPIELKMTIAPGFDKMGNPIKIGNQNFSQSIKTGDMIELKNIYYDFNKSNIRKGATGDLDDLAAIMQRFPSMKIELSSHTDSRASKEYNQKLSTDRANNAKQYLLNKGIDVSRIKAVGYGELRLKNRCADGTSCSEYEHQRNRRTEVFVTSFDKKDHIKVFYENNEPVIVNPKK